MKIKHSLEFLICYFSGHDFVISPETLQHPECRHCHQPYTATLQDKRWRSRQKPIELPTEGSLSQRTTTKSVETVGARQ